MVEYINIGRVLMQIIWCLFFVVHDLDLNAFMRTLENLGDVLENALIAGLITLNSLGLYLLII